MKKTIAGYTVDRQDLAETLRLEPHLEFVSPARFAVSIRDSSLVRRFPAEVMIVDEKRAQLLFLHDEKEFSVRLSVFPMSEVAEVLLRPYPYTHQERAWPTRADLGAVL